MFDIDADSYDEVRTCCQGKRICQKCWIFFSVGIKVIDKLLKGLLYTYKNEQHAVHYVLTIFIYYILTIFTYYI